MVGVHPTVVPAPVLLAGPGAHAADGPVLLLSCGGRFRTWVSSPARLLSRRFSDPTRRKADGSTPFARILCRGWPAAIALVASKSVTARGNISLVGKVRRGNYVFVSWIGDHAPRHVHVYRDGLPVVKWDLESWRPMKGEATRRVMKLIEELEKEGRL